MYLTVRILHLFKALALCLLLLFGVKQEGYGQDKVRRYASRQHDFSIALLGLGGTVLNAPNVVSNNPREFSTLQFVVGALGLTYAEQVVDFNPAPNASSATNSPTFPAGTEIAIKFSLPASLLGVLTGVVIQPITNLRNAGGLIGWTYNNVGTEVTGSGLLSLLSGAGESEITLTPNVNFQGIRIRLTSVLGVASTTQFFHAYVKENSSSPLTCINRNLAIDVLSGVRAGTVVGGIANATGSVSNPWAITDGNIESFATINTGVQLLSEVYHTTIFQTPSVAGDVVKIVLQDAGAALLDLNLLTGFTVQPYLGAIPVGPPIQNTSNVLSLRLFAGSGNKYELNVPISGTFDRIEIKMGGVAMALSSLNIYEVTRVLAPPEFQNVELDVDGLYTSVCSGTDVELKIKDPVAGLIYRWYDSEVGGGLLHTGTTYPLITVTEARTFYVEAIRDDCLSARGQVQVRLIDVSNIVLAGPNSVCEGETTALTASLLGGSWTSSDQVIATINSSGIVTGIKPGEVIISYSVLENGCNNTQRKMLNVYPKPNAPNLNITTNSQY